MLTLCSDPPSARRLSRDFRKNCLARLFNVHFVADVREKACAAGIRPPISAGQRARLDMIRAAGILFIHIPKNAGMSVSHGLYGRQIGHPSVRYYDRVAPDIMADLPRFALIRDPVDRFLSACRFARTGGTLDQPMSPMFAHRYTALRTIDECLDHLDDVASPYHLDYVFRPQSWFITDRTGNIAIDQLFLMDDIARIVPSLRRASGGDLPHLNASQPAALRLGADQIARIRHLYRDDVLIHDNLCAGRETRLSA
ncbi:MAG: sulfotransferase [Sphingobium sp.]